MHKYVTNKEITIGDYTINVDITLKEVDASFSHEFGVEKIKDYVVISVEVSDITYKDLFNQDTLFEYVEENLNDILE